MQKRNILVTGASGFVGSYAIPYLNTKYTATGISFKERMVNDFDLKPYNVILHLAGIAHQTKELPDKHYHDVNYTLTVDLAKKAKQDGVEHFIFMSSVKVFGEHIEHPVNEQSPCHPEDAYAKSKYQAELDILKLNSESFIVSIIRPALVYGKNVKGNLDKLISLTKKYALIPLGGIRNKRSLVFVGNLLALIETIIEKRTPGIFIGCDVNDVSTSGLVKSFAKHLGLRRTLVPVPGILKWAIKNVSPPIYQRLYGSFVVDSSITNRNLDFKPPYTFDEGMKQMFEK